MEVGWGEIGRVLSNASHAHQIKLTEKTKHERETISNNILRVIHHALYSNLTDFSAFFFK